MIGLLLLALGSLAHAVDGRPALSGLAPAAIEAKFAADAAAIDPASIAALPTRSHGRIKPFDSFARESVLFVTGRYSRWGLDAERIYVGWMASPAAPYLAAIEVRDPVLRDRLGLPKSERLFSVQTLESSTLRSLAEPLRAKQRENERSLAPDDKKILEAEEQLELMRAILDHTQLREALALTPPEGGMPPAPSETDALLERYLQAVSARSTGLASMRGAALAREAARQPVPGLFRPAMDKLGVEVFYNRARLFFWAGLAYGLLGLALLFGRIGGRGTALALAPIIAAHALGFGLRVHITGFAPVTSMYGTMVWMAFGVVAFGSLLFALYRDRRVFGILLVGASLALLLTESVPLVLSPDMDPLVAVLRSNFWLTIHVLTISISYAAFTIAMLIGNTALVRRIRGRRDGERQLAHHAYRAMQLGVFLLSTGIILGGWWADYSWGRFWGWDPKETWALIADLGFLGILHARHAGWLGPFGTLAAAPIAYLLVIMAWYGVNFILAAGLHSYGFSSGGATMVVAFLVAQAAIFVAAFGAGWTRGELRLAAPISNSSGAYRP